MTRKPVSADDLLNCYVLTHKAYWLGDSDAPKEALSHSEAKRHLAEAVEHIIGSDVKLTKTDDVTIEAHKNWLRAEQRKRLAEWLGEER